MYSIKKVPSSEAPSFSATNTICNFRIAPFGIVDLSKSYFALTTKINTTETDATTGVGIHNMSLLYTAQSLVRNAQFATQRSGILSDIKHSNVLRSNLEHYNQYRQGLHNRAFYSGKNSPDDYNNATSCFRTLNVDSDSVERSPELRVPVSHIFSGVGGIQQFPSLALGETQIRFEFDDTNVMIEEHQPKITLECDNVGGSATKTLTIKSANQKNNARAYGFFKGQKVKITATGKADVVALVVKVETDKIEVDKDVAASSASVKVEGVPADATKTAYEITKAEMVLYYVNYTRSGSKVQSALRRGVNIPYYTYTLEIDNMDSTSSYNKTFYIQPQVRGTLLMAVGNQKIASEMTNWTDYRLRINNVDTTNTPVKRHSPLERDRTQSNLLSIAEPVRCLTDPSGFLIPASVPVLPNQEQQYQIVVNGSASMSATNVHLFKNVLRTLSVRG